ncbi:MAG: FecR domain-containing protein [Acidobacteriota bacterium]|nr:FecR domain-containing protein [Acidobacteriota bacterium]
MAVRQNRINVEWWIVQKRVVYLLFAFGLLAAGAGALALYGYFHGNPFARAKTEASVPAGARFLAFEGDVRVVRAETRETLLARSDTQLYPGDIVQTQADGRARIQLADGSTFVARPNSVVTIRDNQRIDGSDRTNVRVAVTSGEINVRTDQLSAEATNIVETPLTQNNLAARTSASFGVRENSTEDIRVSSGEVETATRGGEQTTLRGGEYVAVNQQGTIRSRERLLAIPAPQSPRDLERITAGAAGGGGGATNIFLRWQRPASGAPDHYRVEVATSPFFVSAGRVIERDQLDATELAAGDLRPGVYYWRVRAITASGQSSDWSEPRKFSIEVGGKSDEMVSVADVAFEYVAGNVYLARGRTQPGNTIRINGRETITAADGGFQLQITVPGNTRDVAIEAADSHGNESRTRHSLK